MQSEAFYLKFVTGLQCGVSSKLLEYETDWYEVMEILLSRLQDESERKEQFETIASRDLEYWARIQPGGDTLNLKIRVNLEEKRYFLPPSGSRKTLRLIFNDRFSTQVIFHARKKMLLKSLRDLSSIAVADHFDKGELIEKLDIEMPKSLLPDVKRAFSNCWTPRFFRTKIVACPPWCACKTWRKPLAMLEGKLKKTTRRQLYKRVAGKPVSKKAQQKQSTNKIEAKNKKIVVMKGSKKKELVKKSLGKKVQSNDKTPNKKNLSVSRSTESARKSTPKSEVKNPKSSVKKPSLDAKKKIQSTPNAAKSSSKPKPAVSVMDKKCTLNVKNPKKLMMKNVDNVKALKDKVKSMKNKLKSLMETVAVKDKAILDIKGKFKVKKRKAEVKVEEVPKRRSSVNSSTIVNKFSGNPQKKRKVDVKPSKTSQQEIFSPRPTRRSVEESLSVSSKSKSSDAKVKSDVKFTKKRSMSMKSSPKSVQKKKSSPKLKSSKLIEPRLPKIHALKRTLRSQFQEAPTSKRRRQG